MVYLASLQQPPNANHESCFSVSKKNLVCLLCCLHLRFSFLLFDLFYFYCERAVPVFIHIYIHRDGSKWKNTEAKGGISVDGITKAATFGTYNTVPGFRQVVGGVGLQKLEI